MKKEKKTTQMNVTYIAVCDSCKKEIGSGMSEEEANTILQNHTQNTSHSGHIEVRHSAK